MDDQLRFQHAVRHLPPGWQAALAGREVEQVKDGMGGALVFRLSDRAGEDRYLKLASGPQTEPLAQEIARTEWLSSHHVRVPEFLMTISTERATAVLMTAVPGQRLAPGADDALAKARMIGRGLARLHAMPVEVCPFDETVRTRMRRAREAVDQNLVDAREFDDRHAGVTPAMLYKRLARTVPACEDAVVVHGDATLANLLIGPDGELGFVDCGHAGRSDRYVDLAVVEAELRSEFGHDAARCFIAACGVHPWEEQKAAFFRDLYEFF